RQKTRYGIVPRELAGVRQDRQRRRREGLRVGPDLKERVDVHGRLVAQLADAISTREQHLAVPDDRNGGPRGLQALQSLRDVSVEVFLPEALCRKLCRAERGENGNEDGRPHSEPNTVARR